MYHLISITLLKRDFILWVSGSCNIGLLSFSCSLITFFKIFF